MAENLNFYFEIGVLKLFVNGFFNIQFFNNTKFKEGMALSEVDGSFSAIKRMQS